MNESPVGTHERGTPWLHRWAVVMVCLVWPLIWVGGLVTTYDAGMAVPDWPGTYGYNLFLYPYQTWMFGPFNLFIEHGHRLLGAIVGIFAIGAVALAWMHEPRRWVRWLSVIVLVAVIGQGLLGGMRVVLGDRTLAMVHGCTGPLFFVLCVSLAAVTGRWWWSVEKGGGDRIASSPGTAEPLPWRRSLAVLCIAYLQLVVGAQLRHAQPAGSPTGFSHLVTTHVAGAFVLLGLVFWTAWRMGCGSGSDPEGKPVSRAKARCGDLTLSRPAWLLVGLVSLQIVLGLGTWIANYGIPVFAQVGPTTASYLVKSKAVTESLITTAHMAMGSLILAMSALIALRLARHLQHTSHCGGSVRIHES